MSLSRQQNAGKNHDIKTANISFENVTQFKYFGTADGWLGLFLLLPLGA
jgi:hypothetical protein